jgi:hypothetical protein
MSLRACVRASELANFTGIDQPHETPEAPELSIDTSLLSAEAACERIVCYLQGAPSPVAGAAPVRVGRRFSAQCGSHQPLRWPPSYLRAYPPSNKASETFGVRLVATSATTRPLYLSGPI